MVAQLIAKVHGALTRAGISYAVIGGQAINAWMQTRGRVATKAGQDLDILMERASLRTALRPMHDVGLRCFDIHGAIAFCDRHRPNICTGVHVAFAGERISANHTYPAPPLPGAATIGKSFSVLEICSLVAMQLQAWRDVDRTHIRDLMGVGLITEELLAQLPNDMRARFDQILPE